MTPPAAAASIQRVICWLLLVIGLVSAHTPAHADDPRAGDIAAEPGPSAKLSGDMRMPNIRRAAAKVADWQLTRIADHPSMDWTFAPLYLGFLSASELLHDPRYAAHVQSVGTHFDWALGPREQHADDQAIALAYLLLYRRHPDPAILTQVRQHSERQLQQPDDPKRPLWWWCDALFMAPPVWAGLAQVTGEQAYLDYMDRQWQLTTKLLYDPREHLFSRDASYLSKHERNGRKLFWGRGNGWVMAGLAGVLQAMPNDYPARARYQRQFDDMANALAAVQGADGLWRPGLLDPDAYPRPEISGSALITYALAWGVHHRMLNKTSYRPIVQKAWRGLVAHIYADGRLGDIQPIGAAPDAYPAGSSYVYGVGAFLLAAGEVAALSTEHHP